jgi:hypothetical protein
MITMDADDVTAALAGTPKPGREEVLGSFQRKHRRKKTERRLYWVSGVTACAVAATAVVSMIAPWSKAPTVADSAVCGPTRMTQAFAQAKNAGASLLIADTVPAARSGASGYTAVLLRSVQTLSGPAIAPGTIAWSHEAAASTSGKFFAVVWPKRVGTVGPVIRTAPVVGDKVIFSSYGCRDAASAPTPTSSRQSLGSPAGLDGAYAISLRTVEAAAAASSSDSQGDADQPASSAPGDTSGPGSDSSANPGAGNSQGRNSQANPNGPSASPSQGDAGNSGNGNDQGGGYATPSASPSQGSGNGQGNGNGNGQGGGNGQGKSTKSGSNNVTGQH